MSCALVVDDSSVQVNNVAAALVRAGYGPVYVATDWAECRVALMKDAPDLIVIDIQMDGMVSGDVMVMQLRRNPRAAKARFVLYSGVVNTNELQVLASRCHADAFLVKGDDEALVKLCTELVPVAVPAE